jgi:beta-galactosidase
MSALPYSIEKLDDGEYRHQRHPDELDEDDFITLIIDDVQMGVGGINSWGALPLDEHRVHYQNRNFTFTICPTQGK